MTALIDPRPPHGAGVRLDLVRIQPQRVREASRLLGPAVARAFTGGMADLLVVVGTLLAFVALFGLLRGVERL